MIDEELLALLACPVCKAPVRLEGESLVCTTTGVRYPVEGDIPILLADRAQPPHPDDATAEEAPQSQ